MTKTFEKTAQTADQAALMAAYKVGDRDERPWGCYEVTGVGLNEKGEEFCEKKITVNPGQILSLQSHNLRRELWIVKSGDLTVQVDDSVYILHPEKSAHIPRGAIHCMANLGSEPCVVYEKQEGICREEDIIRYLDAYGRETETSDKPREQYIEDSIALYRSIAAKAAEISKKTVAVSPPASRQAP